jgi:uroporphyrinogen decarboxylase
MNATERILRTVRFERPDCTPIWTPGFDSVFVERWRNWKGVGNHVHPLDFYRNDVAILIGDECFFPSQAGLLHHKDGHEISNNGWGCIIRSQPDTYFFEVLSRALTEPTNLDRLEFETTALPARYAELDVQVQQARGAGRCAFSKVGGLYIRSHFLRGEDKLLLDMVDDEAFCNALFDRVTEHLTAMALETLKRTQTYETGLFVYDDMAGMNGPMFSPSMFARYFLPRYHKLIACCRAAGCRHVYFHSDGNVLPLLDLLIEAGFEGINPLEPRCCGSLVDLHKKYGHQLILIGGLCNTRILPHNDPREIKTHLRPLWELARSGGVILGMASVPAEMPPAAYDYALRLIDEWDHA